ncbi:phage tail tape measure protein [Paenibacillus xanthanilyticus]|uniref:Phage tail tape measure protein n=1 Tax=Paenibacillus xanthanilyticus TaxID=1783531 RepID=A0ABV8K6T9_9BACL
MSANANPGTAGSTAQLTKYQKALERIKKLSEQIEQSKAYQKMNEGMKKVANSNAVKKINDGMNKIAKSAAVRKMNEGMQKVAALPPVKRMTDKMNAAYAKYKAKQAEKKSPFYQLIKPPSLRERVSGKVGAAADTLREKHGEDVSGLFGTMAGWVGTGYEQSVEAAKKVSEAFGTIRAATNATGQEMTGLMASFNKVGAVVPQDLNEVAEALGTLRKKTSATGGVLEGLTRTTLDVARLTGGKGADTANAAADAMKAWGYNADAGIDVLNKFYAASRASGVGMNDLMGKMNTFSAPLQKMGIGFEQSIALLAKWQDQEIDPLGAALKTMKPEQFADIAKQIKAAGNAADATKLAVQAFGEAAGGDLAAAISGSTVEFNGSLAAMSASQNAIATQSASVQSFGDTWATLGNRITLALAPIGNLFLPIGSALTSMIEGFAANVEILIPVLAAMAGTLLYFVAPSIWATMLPLLPIIGVMALVGVAAGALAYVISKNWDTIKEAALVFWNWLKDLWEDVQALYHKITGKGNVQVQSTVTASMANGIGSGTAPGQEPKVSASAYHGLDYVPYDGMVTRLHKGERVLTAQENRAFAEGGSGGASISITGNTFNVRSDSDIDAIARALAREIKAAGGLMA